MDSATKQLISRDRLLLQNPYAHIEQMEELRAKRMSENPYAYADEQYESSQVGGVRQKSYSLSFIEEAATKLQRRLWKSRVEFGISVGASPIDVLDTEYAAKILGYRFASPPSLGWMKQGRGRTAVAGLINNEERVIQVASDIELPIARFTGAHEIGHAVLHQGLTGLHRDRPLTEAIGHRNRIEYEADKFAAYFLMPKKLVKAQFMLRFAMPFKLDEQTSFALFGESLSVSHQRLPSLRHTARVLASATRFNGRNFIALSEYFNLSVEAVAIRLEELKLINY